LLVLHSAVDRDMKTEPLRHNRSPLAMVLLAMAALLGAAALYAVAECLMATAQAELAVARAAGASASDPNALNAQTTRAQSAADALKKKNLFTPKPPKQNPIKEVMGILGSEALINGQWHKAGDSVGDAKILAVEPTKVRVSWNGQEKEFTPMASEGLGGGNGPGRPSSGRPPSARPNGPPQRPPDGAMRRGPGRPPSLSPGPRGGQKEPSRSMSPEERRKLSEQMRERIKASRR